MRPRAIILPAAVVIKKDKMNNTRIGLLNALIVGAGNNGFHRFANNLLNRHSKYSSLKQRRKSYEATGGNAIDVNTSLRNLYKRSHPDILRSTNAEYAQVNSDSMQILNGILSTVKKANSYPPATHKDIPFYVKVTMNNNSGSNYNSNNSDEQVVQRHLLCIRTAGGDCKKQLKISLEQFFVGCGN